MNLEEIRGKMSRNGNENLGFLDDEGRPKFSVFVVEDAYGRMATMPEKEDRSSSILNECLDKIAKDALFLQTATSAATLEPMSKNLPVNEEQQKEELISHRYGEYFPQTHRAFRRTDSATLKGQHPNKHHKHRKKSIKQEEGQAGALVVPKIVVQDCADGPVTWSNDGRHPLVSSTESVASVASSEELGSEAKTDPKVKQRRPSQESNVVFMIGGHEEDHDEVVQNLSHPKIGQPRSWANFFHKHHNHHKVHSKYKKNHSSSKSEKTGSPSVQRQLGTEKHFYQSSQFLKVPPPPGYGHGCNDDGFETYATITNKVGRQLLEQWNVPERKRKPSSHYAGLVSTCLAKNKLEHSPHYLFVELDELYLPFDQSGEVEWKETARWMKYEENLEAGAEKWGKPHVSSLCFRSLLELRYCIEQSCMLFDLWQNNFKIIAELVVDCMYNYDQIRYDDISALVWMILSRHQHVNENYAEFKIRRQRHSFNSLEHYFYRQQSMLNPSFATFTKSHNELGNGNLEFLDVPNDADKTEDFLSSLKTYSLQRLAEQAMGRKRRMEDDSSDQLPNGLHPVNTEGSTDLEEPSDLNVEKTGTEGLKKKVQFQVPTTVSWKKRLRSDPKKKKSKIVERLPLDTEAAVLLVGGVEFLQKPAIAFVRLAEAVKMKAVTENSLPVRFLFFLVGPLDAGMDYHEIGRCMGTLFSMKTFRAVAYKAAVKEDLLHGINEFLDDTIVLPPGKWDRKDLMPFERIKMKSRWLAQRKSCINLLHEKLPPFFSQPYEKKRSHQEQKGLVRTRRYFGGLKREFRRRISWYSSDFSDAKNSQCLKTVIFVFLSCFFSALTFGGILGTKTNGYLGAKETLIATSVGGMLFALLSAQPILLLGVTGPMLIFEESLFKFCKVAHLKFLPARFWTSFWTLVFSVITVCFEGSFLIRYLTRFADDILNTLVSIIFISETIIFLVKIFEIHPLLPLSQYCDELQNESYVGEHSGSLSYKNLTASYKTNKKIGGFQHFSDRSQPNTALLSTVLVFGTFGIAYILYRLRSSKFLGRQVRRFLGDSGMALAVIIMIWLDKVMVGDDTVISKMQINFGLIPTRSERSWLVSVFPIYDFLLPFAASLAGALFFLILFVETEATELLLTEKKPHLHKGTGYHWDLLLSSIITVFCSIFGLPWICATSVQSLHHLGSLTNIRLRAPGQKPQATDVFEQRVTGLAINALIGLSILALDIVHNIPVAVLFGVFMYLGVVNLHGIQMLARAILFFVPIKYHPVAVYCLRVQAWKMHLYTVIQLACFLFACLVKKIKIISVAFPFAIMVAILVRHLVLSKIFTNVELLALDGDAEDEEEENEDSFYYKMHHT